MRKWIAALPIALAAVASPCRAQTKAPLQDTVTALPTAPTTLLDTPVRRSSYVLGPGDLLDITILGEMSRVIRGGVGPEGSLLIPGVGVVDLQGATIDQAESRVRAAVGRYYRNVTVRVTLAGVRTFKVFVVGAVPNPGVRTATSVTRVADVVPATGSGGRDQTVHRNILLRRANGDSVRVDLLRYFQSGELSANPTLREGDVVVVNPIDRVVQVIGKVAFPGTYEYRNGETLADLIRLANGGNEFPPDAADTLRFTRVIGRDTQEVRTLRRSAAAGAEGAHFALKPFDAVYVPAVSGFAPRFYATIGGEVVHPGAYPIVPGTTRVRDLVDYAGGLLPDASLVSATLRRSTVGLAVPALAELKSAPSDALSPEEKRIAQIQASGDPSNVVIDLEALLRKGIEAVDQPLQSGDALTIPRRRDEVLVLGAVRRPGIVAYTPGQDLDHFVQLAGGYSGRADKGATTILRAKVGNPVSAHDVSTLDAGDQVIIPFKERHTFLDRVQLVQGIVGTVSALVLTVFGLTRL